jgi:hypothetical protein
VRHDMRRRFWIEAGLAALSLVLVAVTIIAPTWIEIVFGTDPDQHNGSLERLVVVVVLAVALSSAALARYEWRHRLTARRS